MNTIVSWRWTIPPRVDKFLITLLVTLLEIQIQQAPKVEIVLNNISIDPITVKPKDNVTLLSHRLIDKFPM